MYKKNLHSNTWRETYNGTDVIVIEKFYDKKIANEIKFLYDQNKEIFDKYFPKLLKVHDNPTRFVFEFVSGPLFSESLSFKKIWNYKNTTLLSYRIGKKLACFHKEKIENTREKTSFDEFKMRLKIFEKNYSHMLVQKNQLKKILLEIEQFKRKMQYLHGDPTPWNIILTKSNEIWFIDYFNACLGFKYQDIWKFIFAIELKKFPLYPFSIKKKIISAFLKGYKEENFVDNRELFLFKIIYEMYYLTYFVQNKKKLSGFFKRKYFEKKLKKDTKLYSDGLTKIF